MTTIADPGAMAEALSREWYHVIDLAPGKVTNGAIDLRGVPDRILPASLEGKRCLDVGTFDGFWAFELERRGGQVTAVDLPAHEQSDWPPLNAERLAREAADHRPGERFALAHAAIGSEVDRVEHNIYDLSPERLGGTFDFVFVGDLMLHLRDPVKALTSVRSVIAPGGTLVNMEPIILAFSVLSRRKAVASLRATRTDYDWWVPNIACLRDWIRLAGFPSSRRLSTFRTRGAAKVMRQWHVALETQRG